MLRAACVRAFRILSHLRLPPRLAGQSAPEFFSLANREMQKHSRPAALRTRIPGLLPLAGSGSPLQQFFSLSQRKVVAPLGSPCTSIPPGSRSQPLKNQHRRAHMSYINAAQISGNLGQDAETFHTQSGKAVTRFNIASTKKWKNKSGQLQQSTQGIYR